MAYLDPLYEDEKQWRGLVGAPRAAPPVPLSNAAGGGTAAPGPGAPPPSSPGRGTGFVNFGDYLALNRAGGEAMAGRVAGELEGAAAGVRSDLAGQQQAFRQAQQPGTLAERSPTAWNELLGRAGETEARGRLATSSGAGALLQDAYGRGRPYSAGEQAWDVGLMGAAGGQRLRQGAQSTVGLSSLLGTAGQERYTAPLPGKGPQLEVPPQLPPGPSGREDVEGGPLDWRRRRREGVERRSNPRGGGL